MRSCLGAAGPTVHRVGHSRVWHERHLGECSLVMSAKRTSTNPENWSVHVQSDWQAHREYRSFARFACHGHVAAHHPRELAGNGEAEPGAAEALGCGLIRLAELLEQLRLLL